MSLRPGPLPVLLAALVLSTLVSLAFGLSCSQQRLAANYHLTLTRGWELLIGDWLRGLPRREARRRQLQEQGKPILQSYCEAPLVIPCTSRSFAFKILASALQADPDPIATQLLLPARIGPRARSKPEVVMHDELPASHRDHRTVRIQHWSSLWERTWRYRS